MSMSVDLNYLAGFFDGEGSIGIYGACLVIQITQNRTPESEKLIQEVIDTYGGTCKPMTEKAWKYRIGSEGAVRLLQDLLPYLRLKKSQAEVGLEWQTGRSGRQRSVSGQLIAKTTTEVARDLEYTQRISLLKDLCR